MGFVDRATLDAAVPDILAAPQSKAAIDILCFRPDYGQRTFPDQIKVRRDVGIVGERWLKAPCMKLPDGSPDASIQISILATRVYEAVVVDKHTMLHPGDTIISDLDCSEQNMPAGTLLRVGTAVLQVSGVFNTACVKWKARYGKPAYDWVNAAQNRPLRLRGLLCRVSQDGVIGQRDDIIKI